MAETMKNISEYNLPAEYVDENNGRIINPRAARVGICSEWEYFSMKPAFHIFYAPDEAFKVSKAWESHPMLREWLIDYAKEIHSVMEEWEIRDDQDQRDYQRAMTSLESIA